MTVTVDRREAQDAQASDRLASVDPEVWAAMIGERDRQAWKIELIASENYVSSAVLEAQGSWLTNKYAEGQPGKRYYGGCEFVDVVETLAEERAIALFPGAEHVNVQPHSGAQANMAAYLAVLDHGDRILGMSLAHGGHLTHGSPVNFSGRWYEVHAYGVAPEDERIDYDALEVQAREVRPKLIVAGASAYPRIIDFERLGRDRPRERRAAHGGHGAHRGPHRRGPPPQPVPPRRHRHDDDPQDAARTSWRPGVRPRRASPPRSTRRSSRARRAARSCTSSRPRPSRCSRPAPTRSERTSAGRSTTRQRSPGRLPPPARASCRAARTTTCILVDVTPLGVTGKEAERLLDDIGITVNKNAIPFDPLPPNTASGIRVGTPAVTTRGFGPVEMERVGTLIVRALRGRDDSSLMAELAREVHDICARFPVPGLPAA